MGEDLEKQIEELVSDRKKFNEFVYTPLEEAIGEIEKRQADVDLTKKVAIYLNNHIPEPLTKESRFVIFRHLCTSNYELHRFISIADGFDYNLMLCEYKNDKFTPNNPLKYFLGRLGFHFGYGRNGGHKVIYRNIIDFNSSNGRPLRTIKTLWGQNLTDFHRELLTTRYPKLNGKNLFFDYSDWFQQNGGSAKKYYEKLLALFIYHGILFENFSLEGEEYNFTKEYFLPAFLKVTKKLGYRPLIIALEPTEVENEYFWLCHPSGELSFVDQKLGK
jgi:hypothetical protein